MRIVCYTTFIVTQTERRKMNATYTQADRAIAQYDSFVCAAVGKPWGEVQGRQATVLAFNAVDACQSAASDKTLNATTRAIYKKQAAAMALAV